MQFPCNSTAFLFHFLNGFVISKCPNTTQWADVPLPPGRPETAPAARAFSAAARPSPSQPLHVAASHDSTDHAPSTANTKRMNPTWTLPALEIPLGNSSTFFTIRCLHYWLPPPRPDCKHNHTFSIYPERYYYTFIPFAPNVTWFTDVISIAVLSLVIVSFTAASSTCILICAFIFFSLVQHLCCHFTQ